MNLKFVSAPTGELLHKLRACNTGGFWSAIRSRSEEKIELLRVLGASSEPAVMLKIADYLLASEDKVRRAAREAIARLFSQVPVGRLAELDERVREVGSYQLCDGNGWWETRPEDVARLATGEHSLFILGLASFHSNGRVREAALRALAGHRGGAELPFFLIRLNDWVQPVQAFALTAIQSRLIPDYAGHFLANLSLVLRLELCGRASHEALVREVGTLLRRPECRHHLLAGIATGDRGLRRACLRLLTEVEGPGRLSVLRAALADPDSVIRFWVARRLLPAAGLEELPPLLTELARDPFMPIRREALQTLVTRLPALALPCLKEALVDRHASVRETARYYLGREVGLDPAAFYRERLGMETGHRLAGAIRGLGETGVAADADLIRPFLDAREARLRKAALFTLARLARDQFQGEFMTALVDPRPGVSKEAGKILLSLVHRVDAGILLSLAREHEHEHVRKNALKLVPRLDKWVSLPTLISLGADDSPFAATVKNFLDAWLKSTTRSYARPTGSQVAEAEQSLNEVSQAMDPALHRKLASFLKEMSAP